MTGPPGPTPAAPMVSVIVPAYNVAPYIGEALASAMAQTYTDYEVIVVDDGSTDDLDGALAPFRDRIVLIHQDNRGLPAARNAAWRRARGRYVALLDGDDAWLPTYLERLVGRLEADPGLGLVSPDAILFGDSPHAGRRYHDLYPTREQVTLDGLLAGDCFLFVGAMFRRDLSAVVDMFDETIRTGGEDLDLWLRLACRGVRMGHVAEPLVRYRQRPGSLSRREAASLAGNLPIFRKVLTAPGVTPRQRVLARRQIADREARIAAIEAKRYIAQGDFVSARTTLARANRHYRQPKIAVALAALRVAPRLVAWIVAWRHPARSG